MDKNTDSPDEKTSYDLEVIEPEEYNLVSQSEEDLTRTDGGNFDDIRNESSEVRTTEGFRTKYERLVEKYIEVQDELNDELRAENKRVIEGYGDVVNALEELDEDYEELDDEYRKVLDNYENAVDRLIYTLDDFSGASRNKGFKEGITGGLFVVGGILSAEQYSLDGAVDFYFNAISNYANEPETAILTLGLPLLGFWYLSSASNSLNDSRELQDAANKWRRRKEDIEEVDRRQSRIMDEIDVIETGR